MDGKKKSILRGTAATLGTTAAVALALLFGVNASATPADGAPVMGYEAAVENGVKVFVDAPEGALPEGAELHAELVESEKDTEAVADELEKAEVSYDGFLALDVFFADADGNEVEPSEPVDVRFELPEGAVPEGAEDLAVHHLAEAEDGTVAEAEAVADDADATEGTVAVQDDASLDAEFTVDSLSVFTVAWSEAKSSEDDVMETAGESASAEVAPLSVEGRAAGDGSDMTINLHDYSRENGNSINTGHTLQFGSVGGQAGQNINAWTGSDGGVYQGIVASTIGDDGYPHLASQHGGESLAYLFQSETEGEARGVTSHDDVTGLFRLDSDGYYVYDSSQNYAYYDSRTGSFTLYDEPRFKEYGRNGYIAPSLPQFLPFNDLSRGTTYYDRDGNELRDSRNATATGQNISGSKNYSFGMDFTKTFYMPEDGQVNGSDMVFDFTGDDDVWVFIDDVLVLDLGGIHDAYNGSINFANGEVIVNATNNGWPIGEKDISDIFAAAGKEWDGSDYSTHTIKFYYLERGDGGSNCRIRFNMPTVPDGTIEVGKQITETPTADFVNAEFTMKVETADSEDGPWSTYVGEYKLVDLNGNPIYDENGVQVTGQTDDDGTFTLKHGQVAQLTGTVWHDGDAEAHKIRANTWYKVTETGADGYSDDYEFTLQDSSLVDDSGDQTDPNEIGKSLPVRVNESARLVVRNKFTAKGKYAVRIQKHMAEGQPVPDDMFYLKVTDAEGNVVVGTDEKPLQYYVHNIDEGVGNLQDMPASGVIGLKAGQEIVITDVALGATFKVVEVNSDGTEFTSDEFVKPQYSANDAEPSNDPQTVTVEHHEGDNEVYSKLVVTNAYEVVPFEYSGYFTINKELEGHTLDANQFSFHVYPVDRDSAEKAGIDLAGQEFKNDTGDNSLDENGIAFAHARDGKTLTFTKEDVGETYSFVYVEDVLNEDQTNEGYTGDPTAYRVTLQVEYANAARTALKVTATVEKCTSFNGDPDSTSNSWEPVGNKHVATSDAEQKEPYSITFHNEYNLLGLQIVKVDKETKDRLPGAVFTLTDSNGNPVQAYKAPDPSDENKVDGDAVTDSQGILYFYGLKDGTYTLTETRFPIGYQEAEEGVSFSLRVNKGVIEMKNSAGEWVDLKQARPNGNPEDVTEGNNLIDNCFYMQVSNTPIPELPTSGSSGTLVLGSTGTAAIIVAGVYLANRKYGFIR